MRGGGIRLGRIGRVIVAAAVLLVALSPTLLFGGSPSAFGLVLSGTGILAAGILVRWGGGEAARRVGAVLMAMGALIVVLAIALLALLLAGWGRGY